MKKRIIILICILIINIDCKLINVFIFNLSLLYKVNLILLKNQRMRLIIMSHIILILVE